MLSGRKSELVVAGGPGSGSGGRAVRRTGDARPWRPQETRTPARRQSVVAGVANGEREDASLSRNRGPVAGRLDGNYSTNEVHFVDFTTGYEF